MCFSSQICPVHFGLNGSSLFVYGHIRTVKLFYEFKTNFKDLNPFLVQKSSIFSKEFEFTEISGARRKFWHSSKKS